jgi:hypothetical protein
MLLIHRHNPVLNLYLYVYLLFVNLYMSNDGQQQSINRLLSLPTYFINSTMMAQG